MSKDVLTDAQEYMFNEKVGKLWELKITVISIEKREKIEDFVTASHDTGTMPRGDIPPVKNKKLVILKNVLSVIADIIAVGMFISLFI